MRLGPRIHSKYTSEPNEQVFSFKTYSLCATFQSTDQFFINVLQKFHFLCYFHIFMYSRQHLPYFIKNRLAEISTVEYSHKPESSKKHNPSQKIISMPKLLKEASNKYLILSTSLKNQQVFVQRLKITKWGKKLLTPIRSRQEVNSAEIVTADTLQVHFRTQ